MTLQAAAVSQGTDNLKGQLGIHDRGTMSQSLGSTCQSSQLPEQHASTALAVLLTHISHTHNALVQTLADGNAHNASPVPALLPASPSSNMPSKDYNEADMNTAGKQSDLTSDSASLQHVDSKNQGCLSISHFAHVSKPVKLCPFQEEMAERVMKADNAVIFLPAGTPYDGRCVCPWNNSRIATATLIQP